MGDPWDPPPIPKHGDKDQDTLFASIGRALTTWEELQSYVAHLYAGLSQKSLYNQEAIYAYGMFSNVSEQMAELRRSGASYFIRNPNQALEGELCHLIKLINGWSARRNDVAHGVVRLIDIVKDRKKTLLGSTDSGWCLVPPHFKEAKYVTPYSTERILTSFRDQYIFARLLAYSEACFFAVTTCRTSTLRIAAKTRLAAPIA